MNLDKDNIENGNLLFKSYLTDWLKTNKFLNNVKPLRNLWLICKKPAFHVILIFCYGKLIDSNFGETAIRKPFFFFC